MGDHFLLLVLFSFLVSVVFAVLMRDEPREQVKLGLLFLGGFIAAGIALGWLMYPFPL